MLGVVGFLITFLLQITRESANRLKFDRDITMSMVPPFYGTRCTGDKLDEILCKPTAVK